MLVTNSVAPDYISEVSAASELQKDADDLGNQLPNQENYSFYRFNDSSWTHRMWDVSARSIYNKFTIKGPNAPGMQILDIST
jgi:hypothetical protein